MCGAVKESLLMPTMAQQFLQCVCVCVFSKSCHLVYDQVFQKTGFELVIWNSNEIFQVSLCVALVMFYLCLDDAVYT